MHGGEQRADPSAVLGRRAFDRPAGEARDQRAGLADDEAALKRLQSMAPLHPLGRIGTEEEIAEGIEYLIRAEWTTGAQLDVDGGLGLGTTPF